MMRMNAMRILAVDKILHSRTFRSSPTQFLRSLYKPSVFIFMGGSWGSEVCGAMWVGMRIFAAVGQYDSELLDPHANIWIPAVSR